MSRRQAHSLQPTTTTSSNNNPNNNANRSQQTQQQGPPKLKLEDALDYVDQFLVKVDQMPTATTVTHIKTVTHQTEILLEEHRKNLNQSIKTYHDQVLSDRNAAIAAETESGTDLDVKRAKEDLLTAEKFYQQTQALKNQHQAEHDKLQHEINTLQAAHDSGITNTQDLMAFQNGAGGALIDHEELDKLEQEHALLYGKLNIFHLISHITFTSSTPDGQTNSNNNNNNNNIVQGFMTLAKKADTRPFEIDVTQAPPEVIQDMIWTWLRDEYC